MGTEGTGGAVLCGGRSERFGRDKAMIDVGGRPLAEQVARVLESAGCQPVLFVGGNGDGLASATGREFVADAWPGEGPLGGVIDALHWFRSRDVDGIVVGYMVAWQESDVYFIDNIGVDPQHQGHGLGRRLIGKAKVARPRKCCVAGGAWRSSVRPAVARTRGPRLAFRAA